MGRIRNNFKILMTSRVKRERNETFAKVNSATFMSDVLVKEI